VTDIALTETHRAFCAFAAQLLVGFLNPGPRRDAAVQRIIDRHRAELAADQAGTDAAVLTEVAATFGAALLLEIEAIGMATAAETEAAHA
jgi:hypothetical protein